MKAVVLVRMVATTSRNVVLGNTIAIVMLNVQIRMGASPANAKMASVEMEFNVKVCLEHYCYILSLLRVP